MYRHEIHTQRSFLRSWGFWLVCSCLVGGSASGLPAADKVPAANVGTVADALKELNLLTLPAVKGAEDPVNRTVGSISYNAKADLKTAFEFHQQQLLKAKWSELPGSAVTDQYASGTFSHNGYVASLAASPAGEPGLVNVSLRLHGNVDLQKLPLPGNLKDVYVGPQIAMYSSEESVEKTVAASHKLLQDKGWIPYGKAGDVQFFRQNAVILTVNISAAPAQMGKTMLSFSAEQISAEIPAPTENVQLQYSDSTKQILFDTKQSEDDIEKFYRETLAEQRWNATTEKPFSIDWKHGLIFLNEAKDMLELEMYEVKDENVLRVTVRHYTKAERDVIEAELKKALEAKKNKPMPKLGTVKIPFPAGAQSTETTEKNLEFTVQTGKGKAAAAAIRKALTDAGWTESVLSADDNLGVIEFKKDELEISLNYVDPGFIPAEITVKGTGVKLEKTKNK
jgi:hypothetical protein